MLQATPCQHYTSTARDSSAPNILQLPLHSTGQINTVHSSPLPIPVLRPCHLYLLQSGPSLRNPQLQRGSICPPSPSFWLPTDPHEPAPAHLVDLSHHLPTTRRRHRRIGTPLSQTTRIPCCIRVLLSCWAWRGIGTSLSSSAGP